MKKGYQHYHYHHYHTSASGEIQLCYIKYLTVTLTLIFPICTPFQPHLPGDTISNYLSIDRDRLLCRSITEQLM